MNRYYIKCLMFTKNNSINIKRKIDGKMNLYSYCIDFGFQKFATIDEQELTDLLKV